MAALRGESVLCRDFNGCNILWCVVQYVRLSILTSSVGFIILGIDIVLFFQCMAALFDPVNRARGGIKWGLVAHTGAMFLFVTIYVAMSFNIQSIAFVDNRNFPGAAGEVPPGPVGFQFFLHSKAIGIAPTPMVLINNWLADGLWVSASNSIAHVSSVHRPSSSIVAT